MVCTIAPIQGEIQVTSILHDALHKPFKMSNPANSFVDNHHHLRHHHQAVAAIPPVPPNEGERGVHVIKLEPSPSSGLGDITIMPAVKRTRVKDKDEEMRSEESDEKKKKDQRRRRRTRRREEDWYGE